MKNNVFFSILIPNLGYGDFLCGCLESLINSLNSFEGTYEIIFYDQSEEEIFHKISKFLDTLNFKNFQLIHTDEKGVLKARHKLLSLSHGEYVIFIDSDDYVSEDYFSCIYKKLVDNEFPDIYIHNYTRILMHKEPHLFKKNSFPTNLNNLCFEYFLLTDEFNSVWMKVFKTKLYNIKDYSDFTTVNGDDWVLSFPIMKKAKSIIIDPCYYGYFYRDYPTSLSHINDVDIGVNTIFYKEKYLKDYNFSKEQKRIYSLNRFFNFYHIFSNLVRKKKISYKRFRTEAVKVRNKFITNINSINYKSVKMKAIYVTLKLRMFFLTYLVFKI